MRNQDTDNRDDDVNDAGIGQLLREVGRRDEPSSAMQAAVREAVHAEWQAVVAQRTQRRRVVRYGVAASVFIVAFGALLTDRYSMQPAVQSVPVATIVNVQTETQLGFVQVRAADATTWRDVAAGEKLSSGALLRTDATTHVALDIGNGLSVRLDGSSLLRLAAVDRAVLERGRVYVDAPPKQHAPLILQTPFGNLEHVGTQYQAQVTDQALVISVREGRVSMAIKQGELQVASDERVVVDVRGEATRQTTTAGDAEWRASWQWAEQVAPSFDIDNRSLASFLDWVARETGRTVQYATPEIRRQAEQLILRGSVGRLAPEQALKAVLATTKFVHTTTTASIAISL